MIFLRQQSKHKIVLKQFKIEEGIMNSTQIHFAQKHEQTEFDKYVYLDN
jgi:hypothetical protein